MMDFKEFTDRMEESLKVALEDGPQQASVVRRDVEKLQGQSYTALSVSPPDGNVGMNINLNALYEQMQDGASYQSVAAQALNQASIFLEDDPRFDVSRLTDYDQAKSLLVAEVVGAERNEAMLARVPHKQVEDMAVIYRMQIEHNGEGVSSTLVTNQLLESFGVSADQLHQDALQNSTELRPASVRKLSEVLAEMMDVPVEMMEGATPPIVMVSNEDKVNGAAAMFYPGLMESCAAELGGDYYVLPSSVHEVLLLPDDGQMKATELKDMVSSINGDVVDPKDVLTDQVYHFDSKERVFELAEKFEARQAELEQLSNGRASVLKDLKDKQKDISSLKPKEPGARTAAGPEL